MSHGFAWLLVFAGVAAGCGDKYGRETGSVCPSTPTLTYDNFGEGFFERYCVGCHSSFLVDSEREGAPVGLDFDTLAGIRRHARPIDETAAAGPNTTNREMPPDGDTPSDAERFQLGEWLACGMPASEAEF
jgi:hypothetical protein